MDDTYEPRVKAVFDSYPSWARTKPLALRSLIFQAAKNTAEITSLEETLKWGEPAYLVAEKNCGTTVRIAWSKERPKQIGLYFNCQTNLVDTFRTLFPALKLEGNRAIVFEENEPLPHDVLGTCIHAALTYHLRKREGLVERKSAHRLAALGGTEKKLKNVPRRQSSKK